MAWEAKNANFTAVVNGSYFIVGGSRVSIELPDSPAIGDTFTVYCASSGGFQIQNNASQQIRLQGSVSSDGADGYVYSISVGDCIQLTYLSNTNYWEATEWVGAVSLS